VTKRNGGLHPSVVPSQVFECADGYVIVAAANDAQFRKLCEVGGQPGIAQDERFAANAGRVQHRTVLGPLLENMFRSASVAHWTTSLAAAGVPCGPIYSIDEVFDDPQVRARGMVVEVPYGAAGKLKMTASPIRMSRTPPVYDCPPPLLGEHDDELQSKGGTSR
jgi:formyl-CoA transferase